MEVFELGSTSGPEVSVGHRGSSQEEQLDMTQGFFAVTDWNLCLPLTSTSTVQVTCMRSSTVGHGAAHAPGPGLGEAEGRGPAGTGRARSSVPSPCQQDEPADQ